MDRFSRQMAGRVMRVKKVSICPFCGFSCMTVIQEGLVDTRDFVVLGGLEAL
jgi:hypothetical protein